MKEEYERVAEELWDRGYAYVKVDEPSLITEVRDSFKYFVERRKEKKDFDFWCHRIPGEHEDDLGLIRSDGKVKDLKWYFHDNVFLRRVLEKNSDNLASSDYDFLEVNQKLFNEINKIGIAITEALDHLYDLDVANQYVLSTADVVPYSTTTMRGIYYPDVLNQNGARKHFDRDFLTIHLGDEGGQLIAVVDGKERIISPPLGYAVVFFGVKVLWVTKGKKEPLIHKSTTQKGLSRFAIVHFGHISIRDYEAKDSYQAEIDYYKKFHKRLLSGEYRWQV